MCGDLLDFNDKYPSVDFILYFLRRDYLIAQPAEHFMGNHAQPEANRKRAKIDPIDTGPKDLKQRAIDRLPDGIAAHDKAGEQSHDFSGEDSWSNLLHIGNHGAVAKRKNCYSPLTMPKHPAKTAKMRSFVENCARKDIGQPRSPSLCGKVFCFFAVKLSVFQTTASRCDYSESCCATC